MAESILYDYFRSSSCYRIRIALYMVGETFEARSIDLLKGDHKADAYKEINPQGLVPFYKDEHCEIAQSMAILEYLNQKYPQAELLHGSIEDQAYIRQMVMIVASDMHPYGNPRTWKGYLMEKLGHSQEEAMEWMHYWLHEGFKAYETFLVKQQKSGLFTLGDKVSLADICLVPQLYNARRFNVDLSAYPLIQEIEKNCIVQDAFIKASPEHHSDAPQDLAPIHGIASPIQECA